MRNTILRVINIWFDLRRWVSDGEDDQDETCVFVGDWEGGSGTPSPVQGIYTSRGLGRRGPGRQRG